MQKALIRDQVFAKNKKKITFYLDFGCKFVREVSANCANCLSMIYHNHADKIYMMMLLYVLYVVV